MRNEESPVVIAGAGPAGLAAAISLARLGVETMLVERRAELSSLPRATVVSLRSMELIRSWGVEDAVRAGGVDVEWRGLAVGHPGRRRPRARCGPSASRRANRPPLLSPTAPACVPQDHLEPVLLEHLRSLVAPGCTSTPRWWASRTGRRASRSFSATCRAAPSAPFAPATSSRPTARTAGSGRRSASPMRGPDGLAHAVTASFRAPLWQVVGDHRYGIYSVSHAAGRGHLPARGPRRPLGLRNQARPAATPRRYTPEQFGAAHPRRCRHRRPRGLDRAHAAPSASPPSWPTASAPGTSSSSATPPTA